MPPPAKTNWKSPGFISAGQYFNGLLGKYSVNWMAVAMFQMPVIGFLLWATQSWDPSLPLFMAAFFTLVYWGWDFYSTKQGFKAYKSIFDKYEEALSQPHPTLPGEKPKFPPGG